jgi:uncharacterized damage-inducible protein DinB
MANLAQVDRIRKTRNYLLDIIKDVPVEQMNAIPEGFSNNMIWHLGHMVAAQQGICYLRAGLPAAVADKYIQLYKPGTKPEQPVDQAEVAAIKQLMFSTLDQLENDLKDNRIINYPSWTTRYGVEISSIDDALDFLLFHEGLHAGYITYMKRLVLR